MNLRRAWLLQRAIGGFHGAVSFQASVLRADQATTSCAKRTGRAARQFISAAVPGAGVKPRSPRASAASRPPNCASSSACRRFARASVASGSSAARSSRSPSASDVGEPRVAGKVDQLFGIGIEVEELRRCADVVAVLPLAEAQHERARDGADRVVLGNDRPLPSVAPFASANSDAPGSARPPTRGGRPDRFEDRRRAVDVRHRRGDDAAGRNVGAGHDQRHAGAFLVQRGLAPQAARADVVAVVARVDHARVLREPRVAQRAQHVADVLVHRRHEAGIAGDRPLDIGRRTRSADRSRPCARRSSRNG